MKTLCKIKYMLNNDYVRKRMKERGVSQWNITNIHVLLWRSRWDFIYNSFPNNKDWEMEIALEEHFFTDMILYIVYKGQENPTKEDVDKAIMNVIEKIICFAKEHDEDKITAFENLLAERTKLKDMIRRCPETSILDKISLEGRLKKVEKQLDEGGEKYGIDI